MTPSRFRSLPAVAALIAVVTAVAPAAPPDPAPSPPVFVIVQGAAGEEVYADPFASQVAAWEKVAAGQGARALVVGRDAPDAGPPDRTLLEQRLAAEPKDGPAPLWFILIGHGTFDGQEARFNLRGEDITATELGSWLQPFRRPLAVINTASASAPFLAKLSAPGRVVITATRSGHEQVFARFGTRLATALADPATDLNQDGQLSLLEAFLTASAQVTEFYKSEGRLATEHALLDDNGDGLGTPASWFRGLRATKKPKDSAALDGPRAHQWTLTPDTAATTQPPEWLARRDALEAAIAALREKKETLPEADYLAQLEPLLRDLARHYQNGPGLDSPPPPR